MDENTIKAVVAICCLTAIEITNLLTANIDGMILSSIVAAIAGLAGYTIRIVKVERKAFKQRRK